MSDLFLSDEETGELTGIRGGKKGRPKHRMQIDQLRRMGIPFHVNARGRPIIARAVITGSTSTQPKEQTGWKPAALTKAA